MKRYLRAGSIFLTVMWLLSSSALIGCAERKTILMPESRVAKVKQGDPAPFDGWILTDSALAKTLEAAERCQEKIKGGAIK